MHLILVFTQRMQVASESRELGGGGRKKSEREGREGEEQERWEGGEKASERWVETEAGETESKREMGGDRGRREREHKREMGGDRGRTEREQERDGWRQRQERERA